MFLVLGIGMFSLTFHLGLYCNELASIDVCKVDADSSLGAAAAAMLLQNDR